MNKKLTIIEIEQELKSLNFKLWQSKRFLKDIFLSKIDYKLIDFNSYLKRG